ncbi:MAG: hypothetical protein A2113_00105 [Candidatus Woykebacteria bacterium GWA1_44_8]|uniref:Uncharacterized protein n=1 Tax=Candidatus Woykebacteria bacterium GWA1_44_8 TaxID=1802591 RepID=A0A1G1W0V9_9BACT|nr:MAG: hypothetical protein A2113_00105 [Candidatus Woykebacteria bacterium GWA1_44_8]
MARPLIDEGVLQSGLILCRGVKLKHAVEFRRRAREIADRYFPKEASEPTNYFGITFRYEDRKSRTVTGFLTRKEKLFGEYGKPTHVALVRYLRRGNRVLVSYRNLTRQDLAFLEKVLAKIGLVVAPEIQPSKQLTAH